MKFSLALLALVPAVAFAAPLEPRQGGVAVNCGGTYYTSTQVNRAINNAKSGQYSSSGYPHTYKYVVSPSTTICISLFRSLLIV